MSPRRLLLGAASTLLLGGLLAGAVPAQAADPPTYRLAVDSAREIVHRAPPGDSGSAARAAAALRAGTGDSQPEILSDLDRRPPALDDAGRRLDALDAALGAAASSPDSGAQLRSILAMPRFDGVRAGPSLLDRLKAAIARAILGLIYDFLTSGPLTQVLVALAAALVLGGIVALLVRATTGRLRGVAAARRAPELTEPEPDRFAQADRLAAAGDLTAAVRALAWGVAAALGGERTWEASPLTVREIFGRARQPDALRPLLAAFERAFYGGLAPDGDAYAAAATAAAPYRPQPASRAA